MSIDESVQNKGHLASDMPLSMALLEVAIVFGAFLTLFRILCQLVTNDSFIRRWNIDVAIGLDVACKTVSAIFAITAATTGIYLFCSPVDLVEPRKPHFLTGMP